MSYRCATCGEFHDDLPDLSVDKPDYYWDVPEAERSQRIEITPDTCVVDNEYFFIRGVIEVPILESGRAFGLGVWVSQKRENFQTYLTNYDSDEIGPFFGWLSNTIAYYREETLLLKTMAHFRGRGLRPKIELERTDHQLAVDQANGITMKKAWEIAHYYLGG